MFTALAWLLGLLGLGWFVQLFLNLREQRLTPELSAREAPELAPPLPLISILVPARNEASRILESCLRSYLAQTYPELEIVAVDDRSTDATPEILAALAEEDPRLRVVAGVEPPAGWIGKNHALHEALAAARGEWILATDADMLYHPWIVARALATARERQVDAVTLLPGTHLDHFWVNLVMPLAVWMIFRLYPPHVTHLRNDPRAIGCGGFFLIRRAALEAVGGYEAIRDDVADDVAMATRLKSQGYGIVACFAPELLFTPMYEDLRELWVGFSKNVLRAVDHDLGKGFLALVLLGVTCSTPFKSFLAGLCGVVPWHPLGQLGLLAYVAQTAALVPIYLRYGVSPWHALLAPLGFFFMILLLAAALIRTALGRRATWRGRSVPLPGDQPAEDDPRSEA